MIVVMFFISGALTPTNPITIPSNAKYLRLSQGKDYLNTTQVEEGTTVTFYSDYAYKFTQGEASVADNDIVELNLPAKIFGLVGEEINIYFDNISSKDLNGYDVNVVCSVGKQFDRCFRCTPDTAGTYNVDITISKNNVQFGYASTSLVITAKSVGEGITKKMLVIGDSTTANGVAITKLNEDFSTDVMTLETVGTGGVTPNNHEGISGWTVDFFVNKGVDHNLPDVTNPFFNPASSKFDFSYYMTNSGVVVPDYVVINLGINDCFNFTDDTALNAKIDEIIDDYDYIISSIQAYNAAIKVGIALTIPPNYNQDAFGKAYSCGQTRWRYKHNNWLFVKRLIDDYDNQTTNGIYVIPIHTNLDTVYNMGLEDTKVNARNTITYSSPIANGGVHPVESGYWQIADVYYYWLKSFEV